MNTIGKLLSARAVLPFAAVAAMVFSSTLFIHTAKAADANLKMAFFASPKHPVWSALMDPWGKKLSAANAGLKIVG